MKRILHLEESEELYKRMAISETIKMHRAQNICFDVDNLSYFITFNYCNVIHPEQKTEKVCIYCDSKEIVFATEDAKCKSIAKRIDENLDNFTQLSDFFTQLTTEDIYELETIEDKITNMEEDLLTKNSVDKNDTKKIMGLRRELLKIRKYYEQIDQVIEELSQNSGRIINSEAQKKFIFLSKRIDRLLNYLAQFRDYITQVREAYQAQVDIDQNQIMKIFTVITSVFLPLTLIVGWYGMNLKMPEYSWDFGYILIIFICIIICLISIIIFKKKKWFK